METRVAYKQFAIDIRFFFHFHSFEDDDSDGDVSANI